MAYPVEGGQEHRLFRAHIPSPTIPTTLLCLTATSGPSITSLPLPLPLPPSLLVPCCNSIQLLPQRLKSFAQPPFYDIGHTRLQLPDVLWYVQPETRYPLH